MNELVQRTGTILEQANKYSNISTVKGTFTGFLDWIGKKLFGNKKSTNEELALIEQQKADEKIISDLKLKIEFVLEDNEKLQKKLTEKINKVENKIAPRIIIEEKKEKLLNNKNHIEFSYKGLEREKIIKE